MYIENILNKFIWILNSKSPYFASCWIFCNRLHSEYCRQMQFFFIFKLSWAPKRSWKIFMGSWISPGFSFVSKRVGTLCCYCVGCVWQVNQLDRVPVNVHIYNYSKTTLPSLLPIWSNSPEAKFNIFEAVSAAAHRMRGLEYKPKAAAVADPTVAMATSSSSDWCYLFYS